MQGSAAVHGQGSAPRLAVGVFVLYGVFVVVVPTGVNALFKHLLLQLVLPPGDRLWAGEVQV